MAKGNWNPNVIRYVGFIPCHAGCAEKRNLTHTATQGNPDVIELSQRSRPAL